MKILCIKVLDQNCKDIISVIKATFCKTDEYQNVFTYSRLNSPILVQITDNFSHFSRHMFNKNI